MVKDFDRAAIMEMLEVLNEAKQAREQTEKIYFTCFEWFVKRGITLKLIGDSFVLASTEDTRISDHAVQGGPRTIDSPDGKEGTE